MNLAREGQVTALDKGIKMGNLLGEHAGEGAEDHVEENHENSEATIVPRDLNARGGWIVVSGRRTREGDA